MIARAGARKIDAVAAREKIVNETASAAVGRDSCGGVGAEGIGNEHIVRRPGMNARAVAVAGIIGDHVVIAAVDVDAGAVSEADIIGDVGPGAREPDAGEIIVAIIIQHRRLRGILNADARMCGAAGTITTRHGDFIVVSGIAIALK